MAKQGSRLVRGLGQVGGQQAGQLGDIGIAGIDTRLATGIFARLGGGIKSARQLTHGGCGMVNVHIANKLVAGLERAFAAARPLEPLELPTLAIVHGDRFGKQLRTAVIFAENVLPIAIQRTGGDEFGVAVALASDQHCDLVGPRTGGRPQFAADHLVAHDAHAQR